MAADGNTDPEQHSTIEWLLLIAGVAVIACAVAWFILGQYWDTLQPCEVTSEVAGEKTKTISKCVPVAVTSVAPALLLGFGLLTPWLDEVELPGLARWKRKQEQDVQQLRDATLDQLTAGAAPPHLGAGQPTPGLPPGAASADPPADRRRLVQIWDDLLGPTRQMRTFATRVGFLQPAARYLSGQAVDAGGLYEAEVRALDRLRSAGITDLDKVYTWAQNNRSALDVLRGTVEGSDALAPESLGTALTAAERLKASLEAFA